MCIIATHVPIIEDTQIKQGAQGTIRPADRAHFPFLDGLRGIAALYVVFFHAWMSATDPAVVKHSPLVERILNPTRFGLYAVDVFIVLSGFCLMLPVVNSADGKLRGGSLRYLRRRAWRILPPYYAALVISWLLAIIFPVLRTHSGTRGDVSLPMFSPGTVLSHLFMIHNVRHEWLYGINGALWSVATEWQIYFVLPLILLPAWRMLGMIGLLLASLVGFLPHYLMHGSMDSAKPHFVLLFAMGATGAVLGTSKQSRYATWRERIPFGLLTCLLLGTCAMLGVPSFDFRRMVIQDILVGAATCGLILHCVQTEGSGIRKSLETPLAMWLGKISYSLYLIHSPFLLLIFFGTLALPSPHNSVALTSYLVGIPISILAAILFYQGIERPCVMKRVA